MTEHREPYTTRRLPAKGMPDCVVVNGVAVAKVVPFYTDSDIGANEITEDLGYDDRPFSVEHVRGTYWQQLSGPSTTGRIPAECFLPAEFILEELAARGWTWRDLAVAMGLPYQSVVYLLAQMPPLTPELCERLAMALGTSAEMWAGLEADYREWRRVIP